VSTRRASKLGGTPGRSPPIALARPPAASSADVSCPRRRRGANQLESRAPAGRATEPSTAATTRADTVERGPLSPNGTKRLSSRPVAFLELGRCWFGPSHCSWHRHLRHAPSRPLFNCSPSHFKPQALASSSRSPTRCQRWKSTLTDCTKFSSTCSAMRGTL